MAYDINEIKAISIESVFATYGYPLKRVGSKLWANIRNEKTPSLAVYPSTNTWCDYGNGNKGGSVIDLVMELEGVNSGQAMQILAQRFGIENESEGELNFLPTKNQFQKLGINSDRVMFNLDNNLEKYSFEELEVREKKYSISMKELSEKERDFYHALIDNKAIPIINEKLKFFEEMCIKYQMQDTLLDRGIYEKIILTQAQDINQRIDIYNKARLDGITLNKVRVDIPKNIQLDRTTDIDIDNKLQEKIKNLILNADSSLDSDIKKLCYERTLDIYKLVALQNTDKPNLQKVEHLKAKMATDLKDIEAKTKALESINNNKKEINEIFADKENTPMTYRYYLTQRPPSIGTYPSGVVNIESFTTKKEFEGHNCYGYVDYDRELTSKEIYDYELSDRKEVAAAKSIDFAEDNSSKLNSPIEVAIESTYDIDYEENFHTNMKNTNGIGRQDYYRLVQKNENDYLEPYNDVVFNSKDEATAYIKNNPLLKEVTYNNMVDDVLKTHLEKIKEEANENAPLIDIKIDKDVDLTEIMDNLKNGVGNIFNNENFMKYLNFQSKFYNYSASNNILINIQNPNATNVASFTKWKSLGRTVNKGEKGIMILAPNVKKFSAKEMIYKLEKEGSLNVGRFRFIKNINNTFNIVSKTYNKSNLTHNELSKFITMNKLQAKIISGFRKAYVFDVSQTSGRELPNYKLQLDDKNLIDEKTAYYKNPLVTVENGDDFLFKANKTLTFKQSNDLFERAKSEYKQITAYAMANSMNCPTGDIKLGIRLRNDLVYSINNNLYLDNSETLIKAVKVAFSHETELISMLEETLKNTDDNMEKILALKNQIEELIKEKGITLEYNKDTGTSNGWFDTSNNTIRVNSEISFSQSTKTLLHEYVHSQLHSNGVEQKDNLSGRQIAEIEAEATAYVVAKHFGFDTSDYSFDYVSTWARGREFSELSNTLNSIKSTSESIINSIKAPIELELYNTKETVKDILKADNIKPNDKILYGIIDINKKTGKINNTSDLKNAEKYKTYASDKDLHNLISDINNEIKDNLLENSIKVVETLEIER